MSESVSETLDAAPFDDARRQARVLIGFVAMTIGLFLAVLDILIVTSSLGEIQAGLSASVDEISWVQSSFLITETIAILITGWLVGLFSTRWLFTAAAFGFAVTSAACASAWDIWSMVVFRSFQGLFAGLMISPVFAMVYRALPERMRGSALIALTLLATMAPAIGPSLGGWITDRFSWEWLFLVNVGPSVAIGLIVWWVIDIDRPNLDLLNKVDWAGLILIFVFLGTAIYVLEEAPDEDWFESKLIVFLTLLTVGSAVALIMRECVAEQPIVKLGTFANRNFSLGCLYSFLFGVGLFGSLFLIPLFLITVRQFNSLQIGVIMMVTGIAQFLISPVIGRLERYLPRRVLLASGLVIFAISMFMNAVLTSETGFDQLLWPQILRGVGIMGCFIPITAITLALLKPQDVDNASSVYNLTRTLGGAVGIAALNTFVETRFDLHFLRLSETIRTGGQTATSMLQGLTGRFADRLVNPNEADVAALEALRRLTAREAWTMAFNDAFFVLGVGFLAALALLPLLKSVAQAKADG